MGINIFLQILLILLFSVSSLAQSTHGFDIIGHLKGLKDGETVKLGNRFTDWHYLTFVDSCKVLNGNFHLTSNSVPEGPREYEILFEGYHRKGLADGSGNIGGISITLFLQEGDSIRIKGGDINEMKHFDFADENITVEGSLSNTAWYSLKPMLYEYDRNSGTISKRLETIKDSIGFDKSLVQGIIEARRIIEDGMGAIFTYYDFPKYYPAIPKFIYGIDGFNPSHFHSSFLPVLYERLDTSTKNSFYGKLLKDMVPLAIGQPLPVFKLKNIKDETVSLSEFISKSRLTIVHIWATNSYEREKYQSELKTAYKKYSTKGLGIIGVSADTVEDDWKFMVHQKQYPWVNVSDFKGWNKGSIINDVYREGGRTIPNTTNILLDAQGKIIAWDVAGVELQWYLWKYLGD